MNIFDDSNPFTFAEEERGDQPQAPSSPSTASTSRGSFRDGISMRTTEDEFGSSYNGSLRKCGTCGQDKKVADFPKSFTRKSKQCSFCLVLKKRGFVTCMVASSSEEFGAPQQTQQQEQEPSHARRGSLNITPILTKSLRNLMSRGDAALAPALGVPCVPNAQYV